MSKESVETVMSAALASLDLDDMRRQYVEQGEFLTVDNFLPEPILQKLLDELEQATQRMHRNFIPGHKKGGSVSRYDLDELAPAYCTLYRCRAFREFFESLTGNQLQDCPQSDPHGYALYYYTEPGDHIGFHYDTSYYRGIRYTILLGLVDNSSARLEYELHRTDPQRESIKGEIALNPGRMVVFNGDKLWHRITPLGENEQRIALTFEYLTDTHMHPFRRFMSNMKDAIAYFGFRQVFGRSEK